MKAFHGYPDGASPAQYEGRKPFSRAADQAAYNASDDPHAVRRQAHNDRLAYEAQLDYEQEQQLEEQYQQAHQEHLAKLSKVRVW